MSARAERRVSPRGEALAGAVAGGLSRFVIAPLDVIKIRFQLQRAPPRAAAASATAAAAHTPAPVYYTSMAHAARSLLAEEGARTLWRGNASAMALWVGYSAVQFPAYRAGVASLEAAWSGGGGGQQPARPPPLATTLVAGGGAALVATTLTYPLDWVRTRMASQGVPRVYASHAHLLRSVWVQHGPAGYFQGLAPTLAQVVPNAAVTFFAYEHCKRGIDAVVAAVAPPAAPPAPGVDAPPSSSGAQQLRSLAAGAAAGIAGKLAVYPLDTVKRRLQVQGMRPPPASSGAPAPTTTAYRGTWDALVRIAREEGPLRGWYRGTAPAVLKSAVSVAITFWAYEGTLRALHTRGWLLADAAAAPSAGGAGLSDGGESNSVGRAAAHL